MNADSKMNDIRCGKRLAGLRRTRSAGQVGDKGHDDELQSNQGAGRRADDDIEVLPSRECCHSVT